MRRYVIVYDVSDDRCRDRVAGALLDVGVRVGLSVFEANLTPTEATAVLERLAALINSQLDRVHLYRVCPLCEAASDRVGAPWPRQSALVAVV